MERNAENVSSEEKSGVNKNRSEKERLLGNYSLVLFKALVPAKGQKTLIKKLYSESNEVVAGCSVEQLCTAVQEPSFLASSEGRKLAAAFIVKIGIKRFLKIVEIIVARPTTASNSEDNEAIKFAASQSEQGGEVV
ncbi:unnamed protein product [Toxocara canis]|uniref:Alba domain-containing protein n=1 Tax=Toxocara canis TaxID=6265 RepID=A0A183VDJ9_TOXCA|nr:unnamed protein product [Toxocara canis]